METSRLAILSLAFAACSSSSPAAITAMGDMAMTAVPSPDAASIDLAQSTDLAPAPIDQAFAPATVASCAVPSMQQIYTGAFPTNPYAPATAADSCISSGHDTIIVLGCPNNDDGTASSCQTARADIAVALEKAGWGGRFIPTGAAVKNSYVEADTLRMLLLARGVASSAIFPEPQAKHTDENIYYSTKIMEANGWVSAWIVSEDPGHLIMTAVCDSNCCVELGRLTVVELMVGGQSRKVGHYVRYPWATAVSDAECAQIESPIKLMCSNLSSRLACADDFKL